MKDYVKQLGLDFDPFEPGRSGNDFFSGGNRQKVLEGVLEQVLYSDRMVAIYGPLGSGKSTLGRALVRQLGKDAVCVQLTTTLFMNSPQFFDSLCEQLPDLGTIHDPATTLDRLSAFVGQLDLDARFLFILIDDAHELNMDIVAELDALQARCPKGSMHVVMQGEAQLLRLLESVFDEDADRVASFELGSLSSEASIEYLKFKLAQAGYLKALPLSGQVLGGIHNSASGLPGKLNLLASEALSSAVAAPAEADEEGRFEPGFGSLQPDSVDDWDSLGPELPDAPLPGATPAEGLPLWQQHKLSVAIVVIALIGIGVLSFSGGEQVPEVATDAGRLDWSQVDNQLRIPVTTEPQAPGTVASAAAPDSAVANSTVANPARPSAAAADVPPDQPPASEVVSNTSARAAVEDAVAAVAPMASGGKEPGNVAAARPVPASTIQPGQHGSYEQQLLALPAGHYTVQLLGSRSEDNVRRFIEQQSLDDARYFETRLEGKPWFVVVLGNFPARSDAAAVLESLPADLQSLKPWIRSIGGIQADLAKSAGG